MADKPQRSADVYVFCLLKHQEKETLNPLDLEQWEFYVVSTVELDGYTRSRTTITLSSLKRIANGIPFEKLHEYIISKNK
jgi:hypothetical protein